MIRTPNGIYLAAFAAAIFMTCGVDGFKTVGDLKVVIDTDVGADDAMAILMMLSKQSKARVMAITTVRGNTGVENATMGALLTLQVAKRMEIPVYMGSPQGLVFEQNSTNHFGFDGLGDIFVKPPLKQRQDVHAALALINLVKKNPGEISLLCIGPLTNLALAMHVYPRLIMDLKEVVISGGSYKGQGNIRPAVEFNMYMDSEAASYVFSNANNNKLITLIPHETIEETAVDKSWRLKDLGKIDSGFVRFLNKAEKVSLSRKDDSWMAYGQTAASVLLDPAIVTSTRMAWVDVEASGRLTRGAMILNQDTKLINVRIVTAISKIGLENMLLSYLRG
ncbi:unnamed protein product [Nezara viridula]|uniref:Inosine/uridine-preferring nucleoside hydrolase domain-containing protein n=1 Tax=Nezara viridula TaxID=85310 RepID=A0A9P0E457_NEZVI|nr:unnamed protein product [Nezara viridula]